jgi:bifunctional non-homologous end joining protein LigD
VARLVRAALAHDGLDCLPKVSGSKGLQVYCALDGRADYDATKRYAHDLALRLEREHPALIVSNMKKAERTGRVLVDWSQNDEHKTTVSVYSLRARERPTVSMPVTWVEVDRLVKSGDPTSLVFEAPQALARLDRRGDLFEPLLRSPHRLPG